MADHSQNTDTEPVKGRKWFGRRITGSNDSIRELTKKKPKEHRDNRPMDYYHNPDMHTGFLKIYLTYAAHAKTIVQNDAFNYFIIFVICVAGVNVGIQSYEQMNDVVALSILDSIVLIVFSFEVIVKILSEGLAPLLYFTGEEWKWNNFDFGIVFMSLPFWNGLFGGGSLALLRLVRLMRLAKLIKKIPALQMIVRGLIGGLASIGYIMLLLVLVFYLFAVAGFYMFGSNDPFHFGTLPIALMTMFRCSTLDAWSDVMFLNIFGCDGYAYLYVSEEDQDESNRLFWCENPKKQFVLSAVYFIVFVVISALVMLSLFIGAVTLSMTDSLNELKRIAEEKKKAARFEKNINKLKLANPLMDLRVKSRAASRAVSRAPSNRRLGVLSSGSNQGSFENSRCSPTGQDGSPNTKVFFRSSPGPASTSNRSSPQSVGLEQGPEIDSFAQGSVDSNSTFMHHIDGELHMGSVMSAEESPTSIHLAKGPEEREHVRRMMSYMKKHSHFSASDDEQPSVTADKSSSILNFDAILPTWYKDWRDKQATLTSLNHGVEISRLLRIGMGEEPHGVEDDPKSVTACIQRMRDAESMTQLYDIFVEHCKFISEHSRFVNFVTIVIILAGINVGAQTDPRITGVDELNDAIIVLDKFVLSVFTFECCLKILAEGSKPWVYFYDNWNKFDFIIVIGSYTPGAGSLLTILRLLRLLRVLKLVKSLPQLAVIVNALLMGMNSIGYIGLILFLCFYIFAILGMMLFRNNDPFHFGNLHISMFTLFRCSTLDDWTEIMYVNLYGCDRYPGVYEDFPEMCDKPKATGILAPLYFNLFIIVGAQVLLTLFIGVVTTSMEQAQEVKDRELKLERQCKSVKNSLELTEVQMKCFRSVFNMLDYDKSGTIEEAEIAACFESIEDLLYPSSVEEEVRKTDPEGRGIDLVTLIVVMCNLPSCKHKRVLRRAVRRWKYNRTRRGRFFWSGKSVRQSGYSSGSSEYGPSSMKSITKLSMKKMSQKQLLPTLRDDSASRPSSVKADVLDVELFETAKEQDLPRRPRQVTI
mmetsp:Transcript_20638/g.29626  ORF Transcript_20638/g.29626 Transcript_20638/m.29626 type:complete len:1040 (+) Transcript_20638:217-3336(+)|eukprot:CAMPEP_0185039830 /NCGR_PEP_ID=MMETSP1103-20130426/37146_1 /TAXON_ID=36769 /ORGANISM="Paraphysomonas bandaiensis, Strain Caron Lab Isolate" /LENGTH=1039 /DNA_ID=CAMNT_0027578879 /DNA_START=134 /DNA_END=3253 /DNA_ORIENTATION=+